MRDNLTIFSNEDGFTLLEVLVAFVILSGALGVIYMMLGSGVFASDTAKNEAEAILIAKSKMSEAVIVGESTEGEIGNYRWVSTITDTSQEEEDGLPHLLNIKVSVTWDEFRGEREVAFETLKLVPGDYVRGRR